MRVSINALKPDLDFTQIDEFISESIASFLIKSVTHNIVIKIILDMLFILRFRKVSHYSHIISTIIYSIK